MRGCGGLLADAPVVVFINDTKMDVIKRDGWMDVMKGRGETCGYRL